jgi:hypothetical protein
LTLIIYVLSLLNYIPLISKNEKGKFWNVNCSIMSMVYLHTRSFRIWQLYQRFVNNLQQREKNDDYHLIDRYVLFFAAIRVDLIIAKSTNSF